MIKQCDQYQTCSLFIMDPVIESRRVCPSKKLVLYQFSDGNLVCLDVDTGKREYCDCGTKRCAHQRIAKNAECQFVSSLTHHADERDRKRVC
jgi:hypothetical protein